MTRHSLMVVWMTVNHTILSIFRVFLLFSKYSEVFYNYSHRNSSCQIIKVTIGRKPLIQKFAISFIILRSSGFTTHSLAQPVAREKVNRSKGCNFILCSLTIYSKCLVPRFSVTPLDLATKRGALWMVFYSVEQRDDHQIQPVVESVTMTDVHPRLNVWLIQGHITPHERREIRYRKISPVACLLPYRRSQLLIMIFIFFPSFKPHRACTPLKKIKNGQINEPPRSTLNRTVASISLMQFRIWIIHQHCWIF